MIIDNVNACAMLKLYLKKNINYIKQTIKKKKTWNLS